MDEDTLFLSSSELAMVVEALLEPKVNPKIRQARGILALKLHRHFLTTGNSATDKSAAKVYDVCFSDDLSASQTQVRLEFFPNLQAC
jgi:hypothetical protein